MGKLTLKSEQDGMGFFYGRYHADDDTVVRVDVLPPKSHPRPHFAVSSDGMHDTDWIVFADGLPKTATGKFQRYMLRD